LQISEAHAEPEENSLYSVASKTTSVRVQKAVDPEVAALLDDSDVSRLGSDVEDLEEDFVVQANLLEDEDGEEKSPFCNKTSFCEESLVKKSPDIAHVLQVSTHSRDTDDSGPFHGVANGVPGVECVAEKPRARRLLDEQFDLVSFLSIAFCSVSIFWFSVAFSLGIVVFNEACRASLFLVSEEDAFAKFCLLL